MWYALIAALIPLVVAVLLGLRQARNATALRVQPEPFFIKPYLQPGDASRQGQRQSIELAWHSRTPDGSWSVQYRPLTPDDASSWQNAPLPNRTNVILEQVPDSYRFTTHLEGLPPGAPFQYRITLNDREVFSARGMTRKAIEQEFRFALFGDLAEGGDACKKIAYAAYKQNPDLLVLPGDIVYKRGSVSEYMERFFPVYNCDEASPDKGAPLLRSTLAITTVGNHDVAMQNVADVPDLDRHPDLMGYFMFWSQPRNGPLSKDASKSVPQLEGSHERREAMLRACGDRYPRMANFSIDAGNTHWLVLDANAYMDWTDPVLRAWVEKDLAGTTARWKFVCYHQPAFTTDVKHADEQQMRLLCAIFEKHGVDAVFSGHNHTYERNYPLRFTVVPGADGSPVDSSGRVNGTLELDKAYDGVNNTCPQGVLYIVSGAGGAKLYLSPDRRAKANALPPYTYKLVDDKHSFTVCDVQQDKLTFRQLTADGAEIDRFVISKKA